MTKSKESEMMHSFPLWILFFVIVVDAVLDEEAEMIIRRGGWPTE